ncbi:hypothetical protein [Listeria innocua]|uniref:hypothetical protein n=1 Tax=Listeria innocua TaxID=1642 RepID=UPI001623DCB7|nr:hypothetical protein [Listeria innocua]
MDEYVKIKLETYEYFKELEKNKQSKMLAELLGPAITTENLYSGSNVYASFTKVNQAKIEKIIKEVFCISKDDEIVWE